MKTTDDKSALSALSPSPSGWDAGAEAMRELCVMEADYYDQSPGDDTPMSAVMAAQVGIAQSISRAIRALPLPTQPAGAG